MNINRIGNFISEKRKEKNLTQAQLAEKLGVSNKTISKWENGKCMPDYGIIENLCKELGITIQELIYGENNDKEVSSFDETQIIDLIRRINELESQRTTIFGLILLLLGFAMYAFSSTMGGTDFKDFISGLLLGLSIGEMLIGIYFVGANFKKNIRIFTLFFLDNNCGVLRWKQI